MAASSTSSHLATALRVRVRAVRQRRPKSIINLGAAGARCSREFRECPGVGERSGSNRSARVATEEHDGDQRRGHEGGQSEITSGNGSGSNGEALLCLAEDAESEAVALAAIKDALDRGGIRAKTAVSVEVSTKPFELVFDAISAGPRNEPVASLDSAELQPGRAHTVPTPCPQLHVSSRLRIDFRQFVGDVEWLACAESSSG